MAFQRGRGISLIALFVSCCLVAGHTCAAQTAPSSTSSYTPTMTLDVVSVRESKPDSAGFMVGGGFAGSTSSLKLTNVTIQFLIQMAYKLGRNHLDSLPDWTNRPMYNVQGKADEATDAKLATLPKEQLQLEQSHMLQAVLVERFHLQAHWETRQQAMLNLVIAKGGPKLSPAGLLQLTPDEVKNYASGKVPEVHQRGNGQHGYELIGHSAHVASLAQFVGFVTGMDVTNTTGLTGTYDFDLQYSDASDDEHDANPNLWPPIRDALKGQLGLTLEHTKGPVQVLVVDHVEPPSLN